jgi:hypothetical protein
MGIEQDECKEASRYAHGLVYKKLKILRDAMKIQRDKKAKEVKQETMELPDDDRRVQPGQ